MKIIGGERNAQRSAARNPRFIKALIALPLLSGNQRVRRNLSESPRLVPLPHGGEGGLEVLWRGGQVRLLVQGGYRHGRADFNALFDFMEADPNGTPLPESITQIPYDDRRSRRGSGAFPSVRASQKLSDRCVSVILLRFGGHFGVGSLS